MRPCCICLGSCSVSFGCGVLVFHRVVRGCFITFIISPITPPVESNDSAIRVEYKTALLSNFLRNSLSIITPAIAVATRATLVIVSISVASIVITAVAVDVVITIVITCKMQNREV